MARAVRSSGERTRARILEAALPLFAQYGFAGTSTRMVAQAADVNVATLAYYFDGKEGLYLTVLQRLHEDMADNLPEAIPPGDPNEILAWLGREAWRFGVEHRLHIKLTLRHVLDQGQHDDVVATRWFEPLMQRAEGIVGVFRPGWSVEQRRLLVLTLMHAIVRLVIEDEKQLRLMLGNTTADLDEIVPAWITSMLHRELGIPTADG